MYLVLSCFIMIHILISLISLMMNNEDDDDYKFYKEIPNAVFHALIFMFILYMWLLYGYINIFVFYIFIVSFFCLISYLRFHYSDKEFKTTIEKALFEITANWKKWTNRGIFVDFFSNVWNFLIAISGVIFSLYNSSKLLSSIPLCLIYIIISSVMGHHAAFKQLIHSWDFIIFSFIFISLYVIALAVLLIFYLRTENFSIEEYKSTPFFRQFSYEVWIKIFGNSFEDVRQCALEFYVVIWLMTVMFGLAVFFIKKIMRKLF